jgi:vacuolar-type H+-ATPase subunit F/Vma7
MAETKVPAIKNIPAKTDPETKLALESIKEAVEVRLGRRGDPKDRAVTLR